MVSWLEGFETSIQQKEFALPGKGSLMLACASFAVGREVEHQIETNWTTFEAP